MGVCTVHKYAQHYCGSHKLTEPYLFTCLDDGRVGLLHKIRGVKVCGGQ